MNIEVQNKCLLSKWLYKLINQQAIWQQLFKRKYMQDKTIGQVQRKPTDSQFWTGLMKVRDCFIGFGSFHPNNGKNT